MFYIHLKVDFAYKSMRIALTRSYNISKSDQNE